MSSNYNNNNNNNNNNQSFDVLDIYITDEVQPGDTFYNLHLGVGVFSSTFMVHR